MIHITDELDAAALEHPLVGGILRRAADEIRRLEGIASDRRRAHQEMYGRNNAAPLRSAGPAGLS